MLSAKELVRAVKEVKDEQNDSLETKGGVKIVNWNGCYNDPDVLARVSSMVLPLNTPRVSVKSSLSEGTWCEDTKRVIINRNSGKQELGPLQPEEALQLLENNSLLLTRAGVPMSLQAAYTLLLSSSTGVTTTEYLVYSKLARAGYKVVRHKGLVDTSEYIRSDEPLIDSDIDRFMLVPLYGVDLSSLEGARVSSVPDLCSGEPPDRHPDTNGWLKEMIIDMAEEVVECCEERKRKRSGSWTEMSCKQPRLEVINGSQSPKYEVNSSEDEYTDPKDKDRSLYSVCERCTKKHAGGEEVCLARKKHCQVCSKEGHVKDVHKVDDEGMRDRIMKVLGISHWDLWGKYAPEVVTIEEESDEDEVNEDQISSVVENLEENENTISPPEERDGCEANKLYINPFHDDDDDDTVEESSESEDSEVENLPCVSNVINSDASNNEASLCKEVEDIHEVSKVRTTDLSTRNRDLTTRNRIKKLTNFNNLVGGVVNSQVAKAKADFPQKLPKPKSLEFVCNLCDIYCNTKEVLQTHFQGKSHMKKLKLKSGIGQQLSCDVCSIQTSGQAALISHYQGKKHLKAVALLAQRKLSSPEQGQSSANILSRSHSSTPTDDVMIVTEDIRPSTSNTVAEEDVEIVTNGPIGKKSVTSILNKTKDKILNELPDCAGKSLLILNKPNEDLIPGNTWPGEKHSCFIEVDKLRTNDSETDNQMDDQTIFEEFGSSRLDNIRQNEEANGGEGNDNLWCGICRFGLETEVELLGHIQSELHRRNMARSRCELNERVVETVEIDLTDGPEGNDVIVVDDDPPVKGRQVVNTPLTKPFRGFWSASEVVTPLASVGGIYQQIRNFGYHTKPAKLVVKKKQVVVDNRRNSKRGRGGLCGRGSQFHPGRFVGISERGRIHKTKQVVHGLTANRIRDKLRSNSRGGGGWSRGDLRRWVRDTEAVSSEQEMDTQDIAEELMGVGMDNNDTNECFGEEDLSEITEQAKVWAQRQRHSKEDDIEHISNIKETVDCGSIQKKTEQEIIRVEPVADLVDLSSSDDEIEKVDNSSVDETKLVLNISDVRSLVPPCVSSNSRNSSKKTISINPDSSTTAAALSADSSSKVTSSSSRTSSSFTHTSSSNSHDDVSAHSELKHFKTGPIASLWSYEGSVGPLISPEMGGSLREVYNRLGMYPPSSIKLDTRAKKLAVTYDLYLAENYKKSQSITPDYRIIIQNVSSAFPDAKSLSKLEMQYPDQVPFLFAVVSGGTVTFFNVDSVSLPKYFRDL